MASTHVYSEFKGYITTAVAGAYPILDYDQIEPQLEQGSDPFIVLEEITGDEEMVAFGDPAAVCVVEAGAMLIHCFNRAPEASNASRQMAETIKNLFHISQNLNGVRVVSVTPPEVELMDDGMWGAGSVAVNYEYDQHRSTV